MISPSQRPLPDNTQHSQQTNIHAAGGIRTHNRSRRAAVDLRLRPRGHWDRLHLELLQAIKTREEFYFLFDFRCFPQETAEIYCQIPHDCQPVFQYGTWRFPAKRISCRFTFGIFVTICGHICTLIKTCRLRLD